MKIIKPTIMLVMVLSAVAALAQATIVTTNANGKVSYAWREFDILVPFGTNSNINAIAEIRDAIGEPDEQTRLAAFAKHDDPEIRRHAISFLQDHTILNEIKKNDPDNLVRLTVELRLARLEKIADAISYNDQETLEAASKLFGPEVFVSLLSKYTNKELVENIAKHDADEAIRKVAAKRLEALKNDEEKQAAPAETNAL